MKDLTEAKALIASLQASIDQTMFELRALQDGLEEVLGMVCLADIVADADNLMERATAEIDAKAEEKP
jgi:hypothetical protein